MWLGCLGKPQTAELEEADDASIRRTSFATRMLRCLLVGWHLVSGLNHIERLVESKHLQDQQHNIALEKDGSEVLKFHYICDCRVIINEIAEETNGYTTYERL